MYGMTLGRISVAREYLRLENSPLATEARYQLWKLNPSSRPQTPDDKQIRQYRQYGVLDINNKQNTNINLTKFKEFKDNERFNPSCFIPRSVVQMT